MNNQNQGASIEADVLRALTDARDLAMKNTLAARIPECGDFGSIAQNLDWALDELARRTPAAAVGAGELIEIAARIFDFKPHKQTEETKAKYLQFAAAAIAADRAQRQAPATVTAPAQPETLAYWKQRAERAEDLAFQFARDGDNLCKKLGSLAAPAAQQAAPTGTLGYALFRNGKQEGIERSREMAERWVKAEIVPLIAAPATAGMAEDGLSDEQCAEICAEAQAKLEANAKNAARYRHLRNGNWFAQGFAKTEAHASAFHYSGELLDSKVDAALAAQQAQASAKDEGLDPNQVQTVADRIRNTRGLLVAKESGAMGDDLKGGENNA